MMQAAQNMTPEQAQAMLDSLSPEEREQVEAQQRKMQKGMMDLSHLATELKPSEAEPDAEVSMHKVILALSSTPAMAVLGTDENELLGKTKTSEEARALLSKVEDKLEELGAFPVDALNDLPLVQWRNVVLLYWHMYKQADEAWVESENESLSGEVDHWRGGANQIATKLLIHCQMLLPQQRWVQPTLAVARTSALFANALWSHTDEAALAKMAKILEDDGLPPPKLSVTATVKPRDATEGTQEITAGLHVQCQVELTREHAAAAGEGTRPPCNNPQNMYEAYWLYVEGLKPEGTPNSLITAKPLAVTDLEAKVVTGEVVFQAPPVAGTYTLRAHIMSTSVIGVEMYTDVSFTVVDDDVPDLE